MISKFFNWVFGSFSRTAGRFLFYFVLFLIISFFIHSCEVKASTIDNYIVTANGNSSSQGGYRTLYNVNGPTGQFAYGPNSFIYFNNIQMGVPDKSPGDKYSYILGVQVCQTMTEISLTYDGGSAHNQVNYIDSLGGYKTTSKCTVNGYSVNKVNYYFEVNGTLTSTGDTAFTDQRFVLKFGSAYNEFTITNISFSEYTQELVNEIRSNIASNELINKQDITNSKLDGLQSEIGETNDKLDQTNQNLNKVDTSINNMKDSMTSTEGADLDALENSAGWLPAGPVDSILNLPLSLLNNISGNLGGQCQPAVLPLPFVDKNLTLPCLNSLYSQIEGLSTWINTIGIIASAFILFTYFVHLYNWIDKTLTMRENTWADWGGV